MLKLLYVTNPKVENINTDGVNVNVKKKLALLRLSQYRQRRQSLKACLSFRQNKTKYFLQVSFSKTKVISTAIGVNFKK